MQAPKLCLIIPCFNEEKILEDSSLRLETLFMTLIDSKVIDSSSFIVFVDDGSRDATWRIIESLHQRVAFITGLRLSRNFGHQNALLAGLASFHQRADCCITIDADLQDDISVIQKMIEKYLEGNDIVYGVRKKRDNDSFFKKYTAIGFYKLMKLMGVELIYNHADFRLSSRRVTTELLRFNEINLFLRGVYPLLGFKSTNVYYDRLERKAGETKYPIFKMLSFALTGIAAFSVAPLRIITSGLFGFYSKSWCQCLCIVFISI